jgi:hypothetical protein
MPEHHILAYSLRIENVTYIEDPHLVKEYFVTIFVGWHHSW